MARGPHPGRIPPDRARPCHLDLGSRLTEGPGPGDGLPAEDREQLLKDVVAQLTLHVLADIGAELVNAAFGNTESREEGIVQQHYAGAICLPGVKLGVYNALLQDAALVVSNDTGPAHMAAAVGGRVLSVLGPTKPEQWAPWGRDVHIVQRYPDWLSSAEVMAKLGFGMLVVMQNEWAKAAEDIHRYRDMVRSVGHTPRPPIILTNVACAPTREEAKGWATRYLAEKWDSIDNHYKFSDGHLNTVKGYESYDKVGTTYPHLHEEVRKGDRILIDDGLIELRVAAVAGREVKCDVVNGGDLSEHKGINLPGVAVNVPGPVSPTSDGADEKTLTPAIVCPVERSTKFCVAEPVPPQRAWPSRPTGSPPTRATARTSTPTRWRISTATRDSAARTSM